MGVLFPIVGCWYQANLGVTFEVVAVDEDDMTIEIQHFDGSIEEARDRFLINDRAGAQADARAWSRHIRQTPVR